MVPNSHMEPSVPTLKASSRKVRQDPGCLNKKTVFRWLGRQVLKLVTWLRILPFLRATHRTVPNPCEEEVDREEKWAQKGNDNGLEPRSAGAPPHFSSPTPDQVRALPGDGVRDAAHLRLLEH